MKILLAAACLLFLSFRSEAQDSAERLSAAQRVTNSYTTTLALSNSERAALKKAVQALEAKGLYYRLLSLNIGRFTVQGKCYNLLAPLGDNGSLTLTTEGGNPQFLPSGIRLHGTDLLNTHFVNDLAADAPDIGMFCYTDTGTLKPSITSGSPFNISPYQDGKAYVNIWAHSAGISLAPGDFVFSLGQRTDDSRVEFFQDNRAYAEALDINSRYPTGNAVFIRGNTRGDFTLKAFGFTRALTAQQALDLKEIMDQLMIDLGI